MKYLWKRIFRGELFSKIRITLESIVNPESINLSYEDAMALLEKNNKNSKTSCIVQNGNQSNENHYQLSIIIPTYNNADFLNKCIESVLSQNFNFTYEMIIINDGSTDHGASSTALQKQVITGDSGKFVRLTWKLRIML